MKSWRKWLGLGLVLGLVLAMAPVALADEATELTAEPLTGNLRGNPWSGSFDLYQVSYPGGGVQATIVVHSLSFDVVTKEAFGVMVYGPNGYEESAPANTAGDYVLDYGSEQAGALTVQIYNYSLRTIGYEIQVLGLEGIDNAALVGIPEEPPAPETTSVSVVDEADEHTTIYTGTLVGSSAGNFAVHTFSAQAGETVLITLDNAPIDPAYGARDAIRFRGYAPDGTLATLGTESPSFHWTDTFVAAQTGEYTIYVPNYTQGAVLSYTLTIETGK